MLYKAVEDLAELCSVGCKEKLICNELTYLVELSKQCFEGTIWFFLAADSKIQEGKESLKEKKRNENFNT